MPRQLAHPLRTLGPAAAAALCLSIVAGCQQEAQPQRNASEKARFVRDMDEMEAGQARTDVNVAEIAAAASEERRLARDEQQNSAGSDPQ